MKYFTFIAISVMTLPTCTEAIHGIYSFGHSEILHKKSCRPIPVDLLLCYDIEYNDMRLPNLLGHETIKEVINEANSWIPLLQRQCHPDTRKFLCSLFSPVCIPNMDEAIKPCRSLCENVKQECAPVMLGFGFHWPDMLNCSRFPEDNDLCIRPGNSDDSETATQGVPKVCEPCQDKEENENQIIENLCKTDFVLKIKVKEISYFNYDAKIIPETKTKTIYKQNGVTDRDLKKTVLWLKDGLRCTCDEVNNFNVSYLVMGQKLDGNLVITSLKRLQRGPKDIKKISRSIRKLQCS